MLATTFNLPDGKAGLLSRGGHSTVVVLGAGRSGTTMTVGILQRMGLEFGDRLNAVGEDVDLIARFKPTGRAMLPWNLVRLPFRFAAILKRRRAQFGTFAFKCPYMNPFLLLVAPRIPNAIYIVVMRNPLQTSLSGERYVGPPLTARLLETVVAELCIALLLRLTKRPVLIYPYEAGVAEPEKLVDAIATYTGLAVSEPARRDAEAFVAPNSGYKSVRRLVGHIEAITPHGARGWAVDTFADTPVPLAFIADGRTITETVADRQRDDVAELALHPTGRCGFVASFDPPLSEAQLKTLRVRTTDTGYELLNRPGNAAAR
ncbi:sulfotransferase family protein [Acuticoccus mangrovi]|uniref:Sulfotransferase family protein n=1 Tax=Acuticoccus mangrovi TaxID=2796142 RepID=A0A934MF68_9HYPH|nr:hypothetical protein [Acuticoccus mangrovi]MBJ3774610.1 hypothetical protein [Acuticoccus mangrovi]